MMSIEDAENSEEIPLSGPAKITWRLPSGEIKAEFIRKIVDRGRYIKAYTKGGFHYRIPKEWLVSVE